MHINNKSTNGTTLNLTIKLHAQYKITVWTTCTYKSHTDTWKCHNFKDSSSTYRIEVWWGVTSHCGRLVDVDRTAPTSVTWRFLKGVPELSQRFLALLSRVPCACGSRLLQNARRHLYKLRSFAEDDGSDRHIVANSIFCHKKRRYLIDLWTYRL